MRNFIKENINGRIVVTEKRFSNPKFCPSVIVAEFDDENGVSTEEANANAELFVAALETARERDALKAEVEQIRAALSFSDNAANRFLARTEKAEKQRDDLLAAAKLGLKAVQAMGRRAAASKSFLAEGKLSCDAATISDAIANAEARSSIDGPMHEAEKILGSSGGAETAMVFQALLDKDNKEGK